MTQHTAADATAQTTTISKGRHERASAGTCVMELASLLAGEPFSDHPRAACPVIGAYLRTLNDLLDSWDRRRLVPYAARVVGTAGGRRSRRDRASLCAHYVARAHGRRGRLIPVMRTAPWGAIAAREALLSGGVDAALALCERLITAGPHSPEPPFTATGRRDRARPEQPPAAAPTAV
jgi:hypothetical protein